jgi:hypothetical protein
VAHIPTLVQGPSAWGQLCEWTNNTNNVTSCEVTHVIEKYHLHLSVQKFEVQALLKDTKNNNNNRSTVKYSEYSENKFKKCKTCASIFTPMYCSITVTSSSPVFL